MRAIIVRHYKTVSNASHRIIGWGESPPVTGWQRDMKYVDKRLHAAGIHIDTIYTSNLRRAQNTGLFYAQSRGIDIIHPSEQLNEVNYGKLSAECKQWAKKYVPLHKKDPDFVYPDGESFRQMQQRSVQFIESIAGANQDKTVLIVVHAGIIRGLICHFLGLDYASNLKRKITHRYIGDFSLEGQACVRYNEIGTRSGFIQDGVIQVPYCSEPLPSV
jgi:alpha-ribazole phosphatase